MTNLHYHAAVIGHAVRTWVRTHNNQRGEGVISTAIAVMIVAFIGAAMWVAFNAIWQDSEQNIRTNIEQIGAEG